VCSTRDAFVDYKVKNYQLPQLSVTSTDVDMYPAPRTQLKQLLPSCSTQRLLEHSMGNRPRQCCLMRVHLGLWHLENVYKRTPHVVVVIKHKRLLANCCSCNDLLRKASLSCAEQTFHGHHHSYS
jgi:hypothetical protein